MRKKPPLWQCPRCGRFFANRNQWHSCTDLTLAEHLADKTPEAIALYRAFEAAVRECGPFRIHAAKTRIGFITRMTFAGAELRRRWINAALILDRKLEDPRFRKVEQYGPESFGHYFRLSSVDEIDDALRGWLCRAYRLGQQDRWYEK